MPDDQELTEAPDEQETVKVKKDLLVQQKNLRHDPLRIPCLGADAEISKIQFGPRYEALHGQNYAADDCGQ